MVYNITQLTLQAHRPMQGAHKWQAGVQHQHLQKQLTLHLQLPRLW